MKQLLFLFVILLTFPSYARDCGIYLADAGHEKQITYTQYFISYLHRLYSEGVITTEYLKTLLIDIEANKSLSFPFTGNDLTSAQQAHELNLRYYLDAQSEIDKIALDGWLRSQLNIKGQKEEIQRKTLNVNVKMNFNWLPKGSFSYHNQKVKAEIKRDFALMETAVTQWQWFSIQSIRMKKPSKKKLFPSINGLDENGNTVKYSSIKMAPNHPVEFIDYKEANAFIKKLNQLSASNDPSIQEQLKLIISDHQKDDIYDLPTVIQMVYVRTNLGMDDNFINPHTIDKDYDWAEFNSDGTTHEVATKLPRIVNGGDFYDLDGNVSVWTKDTYEDYANYLSGAGVFAAEFTGHHYIASGNNFWLPISSSIRLTPEVGPRQLAPDQKEPYVGIRLVRYRK